MPTKLTRRKDPFRTDCWQIYFGDVRVGTIAKSVGNPNAVPQWQWHCGFYPGSNPGETAPTFDQARADFEVAWQAQARDRMPLHESRMAAGAGSVWRSRMPANPDRRMMCPR